MFLILNIKSCSRTGEGKKMESETNALFEGGFAILYNDELTRNIADIPWAKEELSIIQNKAAESCRKIREKYNAIKRNGKTDEENAEELAAAEEELICNDLLSSKKYRNHHKLSL